MSFFVMLYAVILKFVSYISELFDILAGIKQVELNGKMMTLYDMFFENSAVSIVFWGVTLIAAAIAIIFSIIAVTRRMTDLEMQRTLGSTIGQIGRTMLTFLITPIMFVVMLQLVSVVMSKTDEMFYITNGGYRLDTTLFALTAKNAALEDPEVINKFALGELQYDNVTHVAENLDEEKIMMWIGIPMALVLIVIYLVVLFILCVRLFNLIVLYVVSPLFISSMVLDDGAKYKGWRTAFFGKVFSGFSLILALKIFTYIVIPFLVGDVALSDNMAGDITLKILFVTGAVYAIYKSTGTLVSIISPKTEGEDAMVIGSIVAGVKKVAFLAKEATKAAINIGMGAARVAGGDVSGLKQIGGAAVDVAKTAGSEAMDVAGKADGKG